ncbi:MAG: type IV secretory system conjugative DNA transfer family protein, partial [Thermoanaerobaculia bacterium]
AVQRFLGAPRSTVDLLDLVDSGGVLLVNLAKGFLGPTADVLGRLLVNVLQLAALRRESLRPEQRLPFSIVLDEAHNLAGPESGLEDLLVAARKYHVSVTLAAQSLSLFPTSFRPHLLGNTGRQFFFRLPASEARMLSGDLFDPQGTIPREAIRPYDSLADPLLTPAEEVQARTRELSNLPVGGAYWAIKGRRYRARRIQVHRPATLPYKPAELAEKIREAMRARKAAFGGGIPSPT